jgi:hypothetical protein
MRYFITSLENIEIETSSRKSIELIPGIILIFDLNDISNEIKYDLHNIVGVCEYEKLYESKAILYYEFEDEDILQHFHNASNMGVLNVLLLWIDDLLKNSWILKDNAINCNTAYLIEKTKDNYVQISDLKLRYVHSFADVTIKSIKLNEDDVTKWSKLHNRIETYLCNQKASSYNFPLVKNFDRFGKFMFFIKYAREARNIAHKLMNYCSALEVLFSTDSSEIVHKIAERAAFFIENEYSMISTYRYVKQAYKIRSKLVHGSYCSINVIESSSEISIEIDRRLRFIANLILTEERIQQIFQKSNEELNEYFINLILSNHIN